MVTTDLFYLFFLLLFMVFLTLEFFFFFGGGGGGQKHPSQVKCVAHNTRCVRVNKEFQVCSEFLDNELDYILIASNDCK